MSGGNARNNLPRPRPAAAKEPGRVRSAVAAAAGAIRAHPRYAGGGAAVLVVVIVVLVLVLPSGGSHGYHPAVRARVYSDRTACLLTDSTGVTGTAAAPVWAGMQAASKTTTEQVSYLAMQGPHTVANADTYVNTLALRGCDVILAAGQLAAQGVDQRASAYPKLRFVTVASRQDAPAENSTGASSTAAAADPSASAPASGTATATATATATVAAAAATPANVTALPGTTATAVQNAVDDTLVQLYRSDSPAS